VAILLSLKCIGKDQQPEKKGKLIKHLKYREKTESKEE